MPSLPPAEGLRHRAFEAAAAVSLDEARLIDRERLAVLLQGAAVLAHLSHAGWHLPAGWDAAGLTADGALCLPAPSPGRPRRLPQELLRALVARLFGTAEVAGRGEARRVIRALAAGWRQSLAAVPPPQAVADLLEEAPFLWEERFAVARRALAGEQRRNGRWRPWAAAPGPCRRRLLAAAGEDRSRLEELLAGTEARSLWQNHDGEEPHRLLAAGRHQAAVSAWVQAPPRSAAERLELARALFALGQFEKALKALYELRGAPARLLRARCQYRLGQLAAARKSLKRLAAVRLPPVETLELCELAVRVAANLGAADEIAGWVEKARRAAEGDLAPQAAVLAAYAAWDLGEGAEAMHRHLEEAAAAAAERPQIGWRWHAASSLAASLAGEEERAQEHLRRALAIGRRRSTRFEAGELWNELGISRARLGDLAGAERAFLHTVRLLGSCEGPRKTTLALYNLAEIRLRRGRLLGVREIVEEATLENRLARNFRGGIQDTELWVRFELAQGRARAALAHCREALAELDRRRSDWRRPVLQLLAARALGWLGRRRAAADALAEVDEVALGELEPEELPALWAHAGQREEALRRAAGGPFAALWHGVLVAGEAPEPAWSALAELGRYRTARLVFDVERAAPGSAPSHWLRRSIATFRRIGATPLAEPLEVRDDGPWVALAGYLSRTPDSASLLELFGRLGYADTALSWEADSGRRVILAGGGGAQELAARLDGGRLVLRAPEVDGLLRALFALALRDLDLRESRLPGAPAGSGDGRGPTCRQAGGMVGESPALTAALTRLSRLAPGDLPVLILGESGTGKELAARQVHRSSPRGERPFVALNCAAVSENLLLSDLFGHVRGAFTGADRDRAGVFETARGGTVFLDEIGDLPASAQGMLLRVLQEHEVRRVGESLPRKVDVRVVAATHRDLESMVEDGSFRQDLYFRLKVASVKLPPLRHRGGDVELLAEYFLEREARDGRRLRLSAEARASLAAHRWPGNVRELENVLRVAAALTAGDGADTIGCEHLDLAAGDAPAPAANYHQQVDAFRRRLIDEALAASRGNRAEAARALGLSRQALSYLVKQLKLT